jgi:type IV secretory pathway VirB10-like protein
LVAAPRGRSPLLRRLLGAHGAASLKACAVGGIATAALLWCAVAQADEIPPQPPTTTVDAPPPDRYTPPKPATTQPKQKQSAPVRRVARPPTLRTSTPATSTPAPRPTVHHTKAVHRKPKKVVHRPARQPKISLAPIARVLAASRLAVPPAPADREPYLWLAGLSFAVLALAGLSLQVLTVRYLRPQLK